MRKIFALTNRLAASCQGMKLTSLLRSTLKRINARPAAAGLKQSQILRSLARWIDSDTPEAVKVGRREDMRYDLIRGIRLAGVHLMCLAPFIVGWRGGGEYGYCALCHTNGWHNNHHHYAVSNRNGFYWWEIDMTYYLVLLLSFLGIVRDIRPLPLASRESGKIVKLKEENNSGPIEGRPQKF